MASFYALSKAIFLFLVIVSLCHVSQGASTGSEANKIEGYTLLGQWQDPNSRSTTRTITYYISDDGFVLDQGSALNACGEQHGGQLAKILSKTQYDAIRMMIIRKGFSNQFFWIDGLQVGSVWYFYWNGMAIQPGQLTWNNNCYSPGAQNMGLTLYGNLASFGMCNDKLPTDSFRYICQYD